MTDALDTSTEDGLDRVTDGDDIESIFPSDDTEPAPEAEGDEEGANDEVTEGDPAPETEDDTDVEDGNYEVVVDGETLRVPLDELVKGYQRQADYTRKTQALAAERQQIAQFNKLSDALDEDPVGTLKALAEALGVTAEIDDLDPEVQKVRQAERIIANEQERQRHAQIDTELAAIRKQFGEFDEEALVRHAVEQQIPNLSAAYTHMMWGKDAARKQAEDEAAAAKTAKVEAKREAKRSAAVVAGGSKRSAKGSEPALPEKPTVREAFMAAKRELGM